MNMARPIGKHLQVCNAQLKFLVFITTGLADRNVGNFKRWMRNLWFGMYSRVRGNQGSSGFEHVFLGEEKNGISGLHSWFRYKFEEDAGNMNYLGYSRTLSMGKVRNSSFRNGFG